MGDSPSSAPDKPAAETPSPEVLQPQTDNESEPPASETTKPTGPGTQPSPAKPRRITYRPSHKATFIGLGVVVAILVVNAGILFFLMRGQDSSESQKKREEVSISTETLEKLGVNRSPVGNLGTELVVGPDSRFNGKVTVSSDVDVAGQLRLNNKLSAVDATMNKLQAGDASVAKLTISGEGTASSLNLRNELNVIGAVRLQGPVSINNSLNVAGNLTVGGALFASTFQANSLTSGSTLTIGGHIVTRGSVPSVSGGSGLGSNGNVTISGNDAAGTVAVNVGTGATGGTLATVTFRSAYGAIPHVVITPVGRAANSVYITRSATGFSIHANSGLSAGGYGFDYIVIQ
jgi:cytoskeletal protein CcmA (bactofilin family)